MPKELVGEPFCAVSQKYSNSDKIFLQKGKTGENEDFTSKSLCVTVTKKLVGELFCAVFKKLPGSEKFMDKRGVYHHFPSKIFCLKVPRKFAG